MYIWDNLHYLIFNRWVHIKKTCYFSSRFLNVFTGKRITHKSCDICQFTKIIKTFFKFTQNVKQDRYWYLRAQNGWQQGRWLSKQLTCSSEEERGKRVWKRDGGGCFVAPACASRCNHTHVNHVVVKQKLWIDRYRPIFPEIDSKSTRDRLKKLSRSTVWAPLA